MKEKIFSKTFCLSPGESNGQQEMPLSILAGRIIEVATLHAESWNVGYTELIKHHLAWVLSRLTIEVKRFPAINENYTLLTWIESYNKHFSARNFELIDGEGRTFGFARTIWVVLDLTTRRSSDMSRLENLGRLVLDRPCPIEPFSHIKVEAEQKMLSYPVRYSDIDLNRHVNSMRYIEHILDLYPFSWYDRYRVSRFEIAFAHEARPGIDIDVYARQTTETDHCIELRHEESCLCKSRLCFELRPEPVSLPFMG